MPFITNTKNDEFGHAQTQRDIEYIYMMLGDQTQGQTELGMSQEISDDTVNGNVIGGAAAAAQAAANVSTITYLGVIGVGNTITTINTVDYYGLKRASASVTSVPTVIPPAGNDACPDGLTIGIIELTDGSNITAWIGSRLQPGGVGSVIEPLVLSAVPSGVGVLCKQVISMPCDAGGTVDVYVPFRIL